MTAYQYFTYQELKCRCGCEGCAMDEDFMHKIEQMRGEIDFPFIVTSAYRCPAHNDRVSHTGRTGPHTTGKALDLQCFHERAHDILELALKYNIQGIGVSQKGDYASRFIHLDDARDAPKLWSY